MPQSAESYETKQGVYIPDIFVGFSVFKRRSRHW